MSDKKNLKDLIESVDMMRVSMEQQMEVATMYAKMMRHTYERLLEEGFTETQTMQLLVTRGATLTGI